MTQPNPPAANNPAPKPLPPDPRVQAMEFALQLAVANKTPAIASATGIDELISNAEKIRVFITGK